MAVDTSIHILDGNMKRVRSWRSHDFGIWTSCKSDLLRIPIANGHIHLRKIRVLLKVL